MPKRKRNHQFNLRISDYELQLFAQKHSASGLSKTDYFVKMLNSSVIKVYDFNKTAAQLYSELRKIGVNINQIAYLANAGFIPKAELEILNISALYSDVMTRLKEFLERPLVNARIENGGEL